MSKKIEKWKREDYDNMDTETLIQLLVDKDDYFEELTTPPTEQEVCEALSEHMNEPVWFDKFGHIRLTTQWVANKIYLKGKFVGVNLHVVLPPHLVEMIGKFYKGKVKE